MLTRRFERDEQGSLAIAMTVLIVLMILTLGVLTRTMGGETQTRRNQDFNNALAGADAGIADALFQLDQDVLGTTSASCTRPCFQKSNVGVGGGNEFSYRATQGVLVTTTGATIPDPNRYEIHAIGKVNGVEHAVVVTAKRRQRFDYALFANEFLSINGNCPSTFGPVGSSGVVDIQSTGCTPKADCFLPDNGIPAATSNGCGDNPSTTGGQPNPNGRHIPETNPKPPFADDLEDAQENPNLANLGCPWQGTGVITGAITGNNNGYYLCDRAAGFTMQGTVTVVNPPSVAPPVQSARIFIRTGRLTLANGVQVNGNGTLNPPQVSNPASNIQVWVNQGSPVGSPMELRGGATFIGAIYAPTTAFLFPPSGVNTFKGSLIARHIRVNGAPNLGYLDQSLQAVTIESWKITEYREVPSSCALGATC